MVGSCSISQVSAQTVVDDDAARRGGLGRRGRFGRSGRVHEGVVTIITMHLGQSADVSIDKGAHVPGLAFDDASLFKEPTD